MADSTTPVDDLIRSQIPSWNQLFGQNSQCECNECESMIGAPAYLAHILNFAENGCDRNENLIIPDPHGSNKMVGESPYDILIKRAPYLPFLPLTCDNTNTELPYIQVVLEILEYYASNKKIEDMPAHDNGSIDWESKYLETSTNAYQILSKQCFPFSLPYHQPLDVVRTYLSKSKTSFTEFLSVFNSDDPEIESRLEKEYLNLSDEEYSLLSGFKIGNDSFDVFRLYGFNNLVDFQTAIFGSHGVKEFLQKTGLLYVELIDVLHTEFINPGINSVNFIEKLFLGGGINALDLFAALKDIKDTPAIDPGLNAKVQDLLNKSIKPGLDTQQFKKYLDDNFDAFQQTVIIIPDLGTKDKPGDPCNFTNSKLGTILSSNDSSAVNPISDIIFKKLYFFIRLLKKTGLKIKELDTLLSPLSGKRNDVIISSLAYFYQQKDKFNLSASQFICLAGNSNPSLADSLYAQLFLNNSLKNINADFRADDFGIFFSKPIKLKASGKYNSFLLSALKISNDEMDSLVTFLAINNPGTFNLSVESISVFYSYTLLCTVLEIPLSDLLSLISVFGKADVLRKWDNTNSKFVDANLYSTKLLLEFVDTINNSGFSVDELLYILGSNENDPTFQISNDKVKAILLELQQVFVLNNQQNLVPEDKEINETFITNKLLSLYAKDTVSQLTGMLNNKIVYGITLAEPIPDLNIPVNLKPKISYDKDSGRLEVTGVLTFSDKAIISADNKLDTALKPIWDKPFDFLKNNFSGFILDDNSRNAFLDRTGNQTTSFFDKLKSFYLLFQPYLIKQLACKSFIEKISALISLDERATQLISKAIIDSLYQSVIDIAKEISSTADYFPETKVNDFKAQIVQLNKGALFISRFGLNANEINYFLNNPADFSTIDFRNFILVQWQQVNNYCNLRKLNQTPQLSLIDLFARASSGDIISSLVTYISLLTGWAKDDINSIITAYSYDAKSFKNESVLFTMSRMMKISNKTSVKASLLAQWSLADTQFDSLFSLASQIKNAILEQYVPAERNEIESKISSNLLEKQRNALVDYILTLDEIKEYPVTNVDELCGYFLIDVPMSSCMPTTRIRQAISTVQSFIKRCKMGLESVIDSVTSKEFGVAPKQINNEIWEPKSFFRTWQVTMEFLINPYPYLSYKYLIEKSEAAKTLEATLLKSDITQRTVEDAYRVYLQEMCEIANLEIAAMYIDDSIDVDGNPKTKFIHVISKTRSAPHKYYYCTKNESNRWSFLQNIPVAIKENDGDGNEPSGSHLIFTKFRDRYYLFMPEFIKRQDQSKTSTGTAKDMAEIDISSIPVPILYEIKLGVIELFKGKWGKKTYLTIKGQWSLFSKLNNSHINTYGFSLDKDSSGNKESLDIHLFSDSQSLLTFRFYSVNAAVTLFQKSPSFIEHAVNYQNVEKGKWQLRVPNGDDDDFKDVFNNSESKLLLNFSPQYLMTPDINLNFNQPFFFHDIKRNYYVTAEPFTYVEPPLSSNFNTKRYERPALVNILMNPLETIFLPLHI